MHYYSNVSNVDKSCHKRNIEDDFIKPEGICALEKQNLCGSVDGILLK